MFEINDHKFVLMNRYFIRFWETRLDALPSNLTEQVSEDFKQLLDMMLCADPDQRPSINTIQAHPWMKRQLPAAYERELALIEEEEIARAALYYIPPLDMAKEVAKLVRNACRHSKFCDPDVDRVDLRPVQLPNSRNPHSLEPLINIWSRAV